MATSDHYPLPPRTIVGTLSGTAVKIPATHWIGVTRKTKARAGFELRGVFGTGTSIAIGVETCTDPRSPDASATTIVTGVSANGIADPDASLVSIDLQAKLYFRIVWLLSGTSGTGGGSVQGFADLIDA
jgi:hypothetical protein